MKVSLNWAQYYSNVTLAPGDGIDELVRKIGTQLGAVEEIVDVGKKYQGIIIAKVVSCEKHPNADKLSLCKVDDGGKAQNIDRDENGHVQVVCGAPNAREGLTVAWLPPGATVPSTHDKDPFVLEAREIRGQLSNGMLASAHELGISDDHSGIVELDEGNPGDDFAEAFGLNDYIIDIENKMFTHRPDCFGQLGVAREIAGIESQAFKSPDWYLNFDTNSLRQEAEATTLEVKNELPELVPRFIAIAMSNIKVEPSPFWLQTYLARVGIRPINNIVDLTNYFMMLTGQPLHAYDAQKLRQLSGQESLHLETRLSRKGDKLTLLGGKEKAFQDERTILITSNDVPVGIGGIIGGAATEVDETTTEIVLECATFDLYSIRKSSMEHGLFTEAVTRFSKDQSPRQNDRIVAKTVSDIKRIAGGKIASQLIDDNHATNETPSITVTDEFINVRLGLQLGVDEIAHLLENVEFKVETQGSELSVKAPFWRTDIEIPEDIVEEVGRLYGYDHLTIELPERAIEPAKRNGLLELKTHLRSTLGSAGANEVLTYSFIHGDLITKASQDKTKAFQISNALSPDLQYYRVSLMPSLLDKIHPNIKAGANEFAIFEIGKAHVKGENDPYEPAVPKEVNSLSLVFAADEKAASSYSGAPYYQALAYLEQLVHLGSKTALLFEPLEGADLYGNPWIEQMAAVYAPARSAVLGDNQGQIWGVIGEFKPAARKAFKLPAFTAGFELDPLLFFGGQRTPYTPLSRFPKVEQDICLEVRSDLGYQELFMFVLQKLDAIKPKDTTFSLGPVDIYKKTESAKRITLRLTISSYDRTLMTDEVNRLLDETAAAAQESLGATRI